MTFSASTIRMTAVLAALATLQACSKPQQNVFYDPWDQYKLGSVYDCGSIQVPDVRHNTLNAATPGFGCSHQSNLTVMVADSLDLQRPRAITPADEVARTRVFQAYREGQDTSAAPDAQGTDSLIQ